MQGYYSKARLYTAQTGGTGSTVLTWDLSNVNERNEIRDFCNNGLYIGGIEASESPQDIWVTLNFHQYYDPMHPLHTDSVYFTAVEVDVLSVPEFLFASATYATPIKFQVNGFGDYVHIEDLEVDLYIDGNLEVTIDDLDDRFAAGDGEGSVGNGTTDTYTCFINHDEYRYIGVNEHRTDDVYFVVRASCNSYPSGTAYELESAPTDEEATPKLFADIVLIVAEPGVDDEPGSIDGMNIFGPVCLDGEAKYEHWSLTYDSMDIWGFEDCDGKPMPHFDDEEVLAPFEDHTQEKFDISEQSEYLEGMGLYTRLLDEWSPVWFRDNGFANKYYGVRRGVYFCPSYGGKDVVVLTGDEHAMDLSKNHGQSILYLYRTGKYKLEIDCGEDDGLNCGSVSGLLAIGWALLGIPGTPITFPLWSGVCGTGSALFALIDEADDPTNDGTAEATLYVRKVKQPFGFAPSIEESDETVQNPASSPQTLSKPVTYPETYFVGDNIAAFIEFESACSTTTFDAWFGENDVWSKASFWCEGEEEEIEAYEDWQHFDVYINAD